MQRKMKHKKGKARAKKANKRITRRPKRASKRIEKLSPSENNHAIQQLEKAEKSFSKQEVKPLAAQAALEGVRKTVRFNGSGSVTIFFTEEGAQGLKESSITRQTKEYLSEEDYRFLDEEAYRWYNDLALAHLFLGKYLDYNGFCMLDFVEEELCFKSYFFHTVKDAVRAIGIVEKIIDLEQPFKAVFTDDSSYFNRIALLVSGKMGCKIAIERKNVILEIKKSLEQKYKEKIIPYFYNVAVSAQRFWRSRSRKTIPGNNSILLLPYYANHADVMKPIVELLQKRGVSFSTVEVDNIFNVTRKRLDKYGMDYEVFEHYRSRISIGRASASGKEFRKSWKELSADTEVQAAIQYRGIPLWPALKERFRQLFNSRFAQIIGQLEATRHLLSVKHPSLAVYANDYSAYGRVAYAAARLEGIPSLLLQHGALTDDPRFDKVSADKIAVEGPAVKQYLTYKGVEPEKMIVTGQPRFDDLALKRGIPGREEIFRKLGISAEKKIITLCTQKPECDEKTTVAVAAAVSKLQEFTLVIKMHPAEGPERKAMYDRVAKENGCSDAVVILDISLYGLLASSEIMITVFSTTATEAMMLGVPVITINLTGEPDKMPYASSGAALGVHKAEELPEAIDEVLHDQPTKAKLEKSAKKFVYDRAYIMDGKATERVVQLIESMSENPEE